MARGGESTHPLRPTQRMNSVRIPFDAVAKGTVFVLAITAFLLVVFAAKFENLRDANAFDYAPIARNIARGQGLTSSVLSPLESPIEREAERSPELPRPPVYPAVLALAMLIGGATGRTVALTSLFRGEYSQVYRGGAKGLDVDLCP